MPWRCRDCGCEVWDERGACRDCRAYPTLGYEVGRWIEDLVVVPDRDEMGLPFVLTAPQADFLLRFYRVDPASGRFVHDRGGSVIAPQKDGKGPLAAAVAIAEGCGGPVRFDGWDAQGRPVGRPWSTPVVQVTASSIDQAGNVWEVLVPMVELSPELSARIPDTGLTRIHAPGGGLVEPVTSSAMSRLGQRITFAVQDEAGYWTRENRLMALADTQRRNLAGTGGRWLETSNAWDPAVRSVAQRTWESEEPGVLRWRREAGPGSAGNKHERRRMLRRVYAGHRTDEGGWVDIDRIESEMVALLASDPAQAERFFLNRVVSGSSAAFDMPRWRELADPDYEPADGSLIVVGVDGARFDDSLAVVATEVASGFQWPLIVVEAPQPPPDGYEHDLEAVDTAMLAAFDRWDVWRVYIDPQRIEPLVERWKGRWGEKRVLEWFTFRDRPMCFAVRRFVDAISSGEVSHAGDPVVESHMSHAHRSLRRVRDDDGHQMWTVTKDAPMSRNKIDAAVASIVSWECRSDAVASGAAMQAGSVYDERGILVV